MLTTDSPAANGTATARKNGRAANGFAHLENWVFDLDNTLYPAACNLFAQVDVKIGQFVADLLKIGMDEAVTDPEGIFPRLRHQPARADAASPASIPTPSSISCMQIDVTPVPPSPALEQALARLPGRKIIFTNGSPQACRERHQPAGRQPSSSRRSSTSRPPTSCRSPIPSSMRCMVRRHWIDPKRSIMVEDLPKNLLPAHDLGMTTVLVRTERRMGPGRRRRRPCPPRHRRSRRLARGSGKFRSQRLIPRQAPFPRYIDSRRPAAHVRALFQSVLRRTGIAEIHG